MTILKSSNFIILENAYKVLYRWYYTLVRLARFIPTYSPLCFRGCTQEGTMAHIWWSCPSVCRLWVRIYTLLCNIFHVNLKRDPYEALFGKPITDLLRPERQMAQHLISTTKLTIARAWKTPVLSFEEVKNRMNDIMVNEKLTANHGLHISNLLDLILPFSQFKDFLVLAPWTPPFSSFSFP